MIMASLTGLMASIIMFTQVYGVDIDVTDAQFMTAVGLFFMTTLLWLGLDGLVKRDESYSEAMKKIHHTTFMQCISLLMLSLFVLVILSIT